MDKSCTLGVICCLALAVLNRASMAYCVLGSDICHQCCVYTVLQTVQSPGVSRACYGTVHYTEQLKSSKRVWHSRDFGFFLSQYCHDCAESDVREYSLSELSFKSFSAGTVFRRQNLRSVDVRF